MLKLRIHNILLACVGALLLTLPQSISAQSFSFKHYTVEDGLNTSSVYYATQDLQGNMWFATEQGVCKFDGRTFTRYTIRDGLSDNEVLNTMTDSRGRIWFLTLNGHLSYYYNGKFCNEQNTPWLKKTYVGKTYHSCFETSDHKILLGTTVIENDSVVSIVGTPVACSYFENDNIVSIYNADTISYAFDGKNFTPLKLKYNCRKTTCTSFIKGNEFFVADTGLIKKTGNGEEILIPPNDGFSSTISTGVTQCSDSSFILVTRSGALWYPKNTFERAKAQVLLPGKVIYSLFIDDENNYWFCTGGDGVYMLPFNRTRVTTYTLSDGLQNDVINRVIKDNNGSIWIACDGSVVTKISNKGVKNISLKFSKARNSRVLDINIDHHNTLFAATDLGIIKLNPKLEQEVIPMQNPWDIMPYYSTKTIFLDRNDSLTTTTSGGVFKLAKSTAGAKKEILVEILKDSYYGLRTYCHYVDRQNNFWIATIYGLGCAKGRELEYFSDKDSLLSKRIVNIAEMPDSTLALSTEGYGVVFFKNEKITNHFNESNGLSSDVCRRLFVRGDTLWISTFSGLTRCTYRNNVISDIHIYNVNNGLLSNSVKDVFDDGEKIYVATEKGLCIMESRAEISVSAPPRIYISDIIYSGMKFPATDTVLNFKTNKPLKINFSAITFQNPEDLKYRYRIPKLNPEWIETKNSSIEYSLTGAGKFDFEVQAKKANSDWSKTASASFIMIPPFYRTAWFYVLILAAAGFFIYYLTRIVIQQRFKRQLATARQNEMIEHERMRIASDMHDDIGADLTQISIWTNILKGTTKNEVVDKIVTSSNEVLQKVDSIIWALDSVHDHAEDLISYIHQYALNYLESSGIALSFEAEQNIPDIKLSATQRRNIYLVVKELLHNTVKHSGASKVTLQFAHSASRLIIKYSDNGKGFDPAIPGEGLGFTTLENRMTEINSTFNFTSAPGNGFSAELAIKA